MSGYDEVFSSGIWVWPLAITFGVRTVRSLIRSHRRKLRALRVQHQGLWLRLEQLDGQVGALAAGVAGVAGLLHAAAADAADVANTLQHGQEEVALLWGTVNAIAEHLNGGPPPLPPPLPPPVPPPQQQQVQQVQAHEQDLQVEGWEQIQLQDLE